MFKLFAKFGKKPPVTTPLSNINALIREGRNLYSDELIVIDEKISVNLFCAEKISVEKCGVLSGNIISKTCVISGVVQGEVFATYKLEIKSSAKIRGNIKSPILNIEPGAVINGRIAIAEDKAKAFDLSEKISKFSTADYLAARLSVELPVDRPLDTYSKKEQVPEPVVTRQTIQAPIGQVELKAAAPVVPIVADHSTEDVQLKPVVELKAAVQAEKSNLNQGVNHPPVSAIAGAPEASTVEAQELKKPAAQNSTEAHEIKPMADEEKPAEQNVNRWW